MIRAMFGLADGILQDLHDDHSEVDALLQQILRSEIASERRGLFAEIKNKLLPHMEAEQDILYRRLASGYSQESRQCSAEGTREHGLVEQQVEKIERLGNPLGDRWTAEFKALQDLIDLHVEEEESTGFRCAGEEFDKTQLEAMSREFRQHKARLSARVI